MKVSKRDIKLLLVLAGLLIFLGLYFGMFTRYQEKTAAVNASIGEMEPKLEELEGYYKNLSTDEQGVADAHKAIQNELEFYPAGIKDEDFLVSLLDMEKKIGFTMESVSFDAPSLLLQFPCAVGQQSEETVVDMSAYRAGVVMTNQLTYPQLKQCIDYIYNSPQRTALDSVSVSFNSETGKLTGSFSIAKYYLTWDGAKYTPANLPIVNKGVADLFGTT